MRLNSLMLLTTSAAALSACSTVGESQPLTASTALMAAPTRLCPNGQRVKVGKPCPTPTPAPTPSPTPAPTPAPAPVVPEVSAGDATVAEGSGFVTVPISRDKDNGAGTRIQWHTTANTARPGEDYLERSGDQIITGSSAGLTVPILDDKDVEKDEIVYLDVTVVQNGVAKKSRSVITIKDNDVVSPPPPPVEQTQLCPDGTTLPVSQVCKIIPDPTPMPSPIDTQVDVPSPTLGGIANALVAHDFMTDLQPSGGTGAIAVSGVPDDVGAYRQICAIGGMGRFDPALYPGQQNVGHGHDFSGNTRAAYDVTPLKLLGGESTCNQTGLGHSSQNSLYWMPLMTDGLGNIVRADMAVIYYKRRPTKDRTCGDPSDTLNRKIGICVNFPNGLIMVAGSLLKAGQYGPAGSRTDDGRQAYFGCDGAGVLNGGRFANLEEAFKANPVCPDLYMIIEYPSCWDGKWLWKRARDHVVYPSYGDWGYLRCPATNPYHILQVTVKYRFRTDTNWGRYALISDAMDPSQPRGWSIHGDVELMWDQRVKDMMHSGCIEKLLSCTAGDLGNGLQFKGAAQPLYRDPVTGKLTGMWENPRRLVPLTELSGSFQSQDNSSSGATNP